MKLFAALTVASTVHADPRPDAPLDVHVPFNEAKALAMLERIITKPAVECKVELGKCIKETNIARLRNNKLGFAVGHMRRLRKKCMSWAVPSGDIKGIFFPDVPHDAYMPVSNAFDELYATDSLDNLQAAGETWMDKISNDCGTSLLANKKRRWGNTVRKMKKLQDQVVTRNKKKGDMLQLMFKLDALPSAHGGMPRFSAGIFGWDLYNGTPYDKDEYVHPGQLVYGPDWPLNEKSQISTVFDFEAVQGDGVFMESVKAKVCLEGICKTVDVATHDDKFGKKFWFDKAGSGHSDCGGVTCGLNSETETYCYDKGTIVFDDNYTLGKIEINAPQVELIDTQPPQRCRADTYDSCELICDDGWDMFTLNDKLTCLKSQGAMKTREGRDSCANVGGYVPRPQNAQHNAELAAVFKNSFEAGGVMLELKTLGKYYWVDSDDNVSGYFNWAAWENLSGTGTYAVMRTRNGEWYDTTSKETTTVICERETRLSCV